MRDKLIYSAEFDLFDNKIGQVSLKEIGDSIELVISESNNSSYTLIRTERDQWGAFITLIDSEESLTYCQEDQTRSFLDAMIKCLTEMRRLAEVETKDATVIE